MGSVASLYDTLYDGNQMAMERLTVTFEFETEKSILDIVKPLVLKIVLCYQRRLKTEKEKFWKRVAKEASSNYGIGFHWELIFYSLTSHLLSRGT